MSATMTRAEREDLQRLIRQRERVQKSEVRQRGAELLAEFENSIAAQYSYDDDAVWQEAARLARAEIDKAKEQVKARCTELGIPPDFAPSITLHWYDRGQNACSKHRAELRRVAQTRITALEQRAIVEIHRASVEAQTELALDGLTSEAARAFLERLPAVENLMPSLSVEEIAGKGGKTIAEQLTQPTALRRAEHLAVTDETEGRHD